MATLSHAQAVKSLNKSSSRRRFVFKTFHDKIEEIEIDVFRSLDKVKSEPSEGSSFFRDCLVEWRELNTAEDFISFYEQMMPFVQTLPLVLLHKELILNELLSRLQMKARLSLEPILRLLTALSRDLQKDFVYFLPKICHSLLSLLESGADREPETIEQIFVSWSYILMYLQKHLVQKIVYVLKVTKELRYYPKDYVQEFMAAATSFLLRNAPEEQQLKRGIRQIMFEVVKEPLQKSGASALLYYVMRGTSSRFHSKAGRVLQQLTQDSLFIIGDKFDQGSETVVEVIITSFQRLSKELEPEELKLMWHCLYQKIDECLINEYLIHLSRLLSLLISSVQIKKSHRVFDYHPMLEPVGSLIQKFIVPHNVVKGEDHLSEVIDKVMQLMLYILDGLNSSNDMPAISCCSVQWVPVFELRNSSCLTFIRELLAKDPCILYEFRVNIFSAMNNLIETSQEEVVYLLLFFCERLQQEPLTFNVLDGIHEERLSRIHGFLQRAIHSWVGMINDIIHGNTSSTVTDAGKLALLWGVICCYPHMMNNQEAPSSLMDLIDGLVQLLRIESGVPKQTLQSLVGAALSSYCKYGKKSGPEETSKVLLLAQTYKSSPQVLSAVADYLDYVHRPTLEADKNSKIDNPEFEAKKAMDALDRFADNLCNPNKGIRVPTLRILCYYEPPGCEISTKDQPPEKKLKTEVSQACFVDSHGSDVLQLLLQIEATDLSVSTSRKVILLISRIQMGLYAGRISETLVAIVLSGIIGIFHIRYISLWDAASECLAVLLGKYDTLVWDKFVRYFEQCQSIFQTSHDKLGASVELSSKSSDLVERFNSFVAPASDSTPYATVLSSLLQSLQKIPHLAESRSRQIIPLFFKFLGYDNSDLASVGSFNSDTCKGKEWKGILKEWLTLLKLMRNPKAFYQSQFLKAVLQIRLMDENDAEIQMRVLDCLVTWKDDFLLPYEQHLRNLISSKNLREELTTWSLSRETYLIEDGHRSKLMPIVICLLMPKIRTLKALASRKHASVHHRKAVLRFIAQVDVNEIPLFFALLIRALHIIPKGADDTTNLLWTLSRSSMDDFQPSNMLRHFTVENIMALSWKKRYGFLHVIEDIIGVFDEFHLKPFLDLLMGCVVRVLGSCTLSIDAVKGAGSSVVENHPSAHENSTSAVNLALISTAVKEFKDLRSLCLKIFSFVLNKYDYHDFGCEFWDLFFISVKPLIDSFKQEGSSSEKPSSLFSCFLAMSRSHHLVPLLYREKNLAPDIFSILTITTASEAITSSVLEFIDNLLILDDLDHENNAVRGILLPNLDELINGLHCLFQSDNSAKRKLVKHPWETHIRILKFLSKYVKDQMLARKFVDILLPLSATKVKDSNVCFECLQVVRDIIPVLGNESTSKILSAVSPLLISAGLDMRLFICDLLDALAQTDPSALDLAKLVRQLNAISASEMGGLDYDTIVHTYKKIGVEFFHNVQEDHALVVLSHSMYDMSSDELILRHSAYRSLLSFVEFSALVLCGKVQNYCGMHQPMLTNGEDCWTQACIQHIINKFLLKHMGNAVKAGSSVRKEWIELLRDMVSKLPEVASLNSFKALCSEDAEQDFFYNIIHLQKHRRARALSRFKNIISNHNMPEGILNKIFVPLVFNMLFDVQDGKGENIQNACLEALASISAHMGWNSYYALLNRCFHEMEMNPNKGKILLRLICSILDQFHFSQAGFSHEIRDLDNILCADTTDNSSSSMLHKCGSSVMSPEIQRCLQKTVLPKIQKLLDSDPDKVNVNISVAALKVLKLLPGDTMDSQLPSIIHRIANRLKSRLESIRDEARLGLAACLKELGLEFLQFIVRVLRATLKRGYELHVLGYSLNFILLKSLSNPVSGKLDYCLEDLLSVVENDILGDVADEKEVDKIASKMKETRKRKSFETLKMIAQSITFNSQASKLLNPVRAHLQKHLTPKMKTKLESMLNHIAAGIGCNPSVDQTDLFVFIYGLVEENGQFENPSSREANIHPRHDARRKTISSGQAAGNKSVCSHLITVFALRLFHNHIKSVRLDKNNEQLLSMLDPYIKLLGNCLSSKYEDILSASLRCLAPLIRLPLPSLASQADKVKVTLLDIAQSSVNANTPLMQSCLRLLTVLLRSTKITLSSDQLHLLIQFPLFVDLERNPSFVALSLLKAIVNRKLVVHEIYDVAMQVAELMVTSQVESIRKKCSQILLQFLLDYHLSGTYLQQHLNFLLKNLGYEYSTGREAVLEMLHVIIIKFPRSFLDKHGQTLFIHLVQCLANDSDNKVCSMTGAVIKLLIERISPHVLDSILDFSLSWYTDEKWHLQSPGAQAIGLLVEVMNKSFRKYISTVLPVSRDILKSAIDVVTYRTLDLFDEALPFWKEAYYSLVMLEKILHHFHDLSFERDLEDIWQAICGLLLHPHTLLRNISSRLVAFYFATATKASRENHEKSLDTFFLMRPSRLFMIAVALCFQLKTQVIDDAVGNLITENLVFAICAIHSLMGRTECLDLQKFRSALKEHKRSEFLKHFQLLDTRKGRGISLYKISGAREKVDGGQSEGPKNVLVSNLLKKMGKLAIQMEDIQMKIIFNCFGKILSQINQGDCQCYAFDLLLPLYKVHEGFAGKVIPDNSKQLAQEACESIENTLGVQNFVRVYSDIRKNLKEKRDERKRKAKHMAVVKPMQNAKRKLRIAAKHRAHKKRKIMTMKMERWMH